MINNQNFIFQMKHFSIKTIFLFLFLMIFVLISVQSQECKKVFPKKIIVQKNPNCYGNDDVIRTNPPFWLRNGLKRTFYFGFNSNGESNFITFTSFDLPGTPLKERYKIGPEQVIRILFSDNSEVDLKFEDNSRMPGGVVGNNGWELNQVELSDSLLSKFINMTVLSFQVFNAHGTGEDSDIFIKTLDEEAQNKLIQFAKCFKSRL